MGTRMQQRRVSEHLLIINVDLYNRLDVIGIGSFSKVWVATRIDRSDGKLFVVKDVALTTMSAQDRDGAIFEVVLHAKFDHVNIIR